MSRRARALAEESYPATFDPSGIEPMPAPSITIGSFNQHPAVTAIMVVVAIGVFATLIAIAALLGKKMQE
jgi:hypothetical protein